MGKNQSASNLPNIIQYNNGSINFVSGSTLLMQISSSGAITTTGVISGSNALSSSYAVNADQLDGFDSSSFVFTSSFNTYSSSMSTRVSNTESTGSTLTTASASFAVVSSSYSTASGSLSTRVTRIEGNYATTGSNVFLGAQTVCANITSTGTIIAQTLNVQQVTSSVVYSSGSNVFGCSLTNTQQFTGSVLMTGSLTVTTSGTTPEFQVLVGGTTIGNATTDVHNVTGSLRITGSNALFTVSCVGIGTTTPSYILSTQGIADNRIYHYNSGNTSNDRSVIQAEVCGDTSGNAFFAAAKTGVAWSFGRNTTTGNFEVRSNFDLANDTQTRFQITSTGISCFRCQICAPTAIFTGCVGIGTTAPSYILDICTSGVTQARFRGSNTDAAIIRLENTTSTQTYGIGAAGCANLGGAANYSFYVRDETANVVRLTITSGGNVGIGTPSPGAQLDVCQMGGDKTKACDALYLRAGGNADSFCHNQILFGYNGTTDYAHAIKTRHQSNNAADNAFDFFTWKFGDAAATKAGQYVMTIAGNGRVGIGTCAPGSLLHTSGTSNIFKHFTTANNGTWIEFQANSTNVVRPFYVGQDNSAGGSFGVGGYAGVIFTSSGDPVVLATASTARLTVAGNGIACFACQVCTPTIATTNAVVLGGVGTASSQGFKKFINFGSNFDNPTVNLICVGNPTNSVTVIRVNVFTTGFGSNTANIHTGYAMKSWTASYACPMSVVAGFGNNNVGTLAWSGDYLQYTANRVSNYDSYHVEVEYGGSNGSMSATFPS